MSGVPSSWNPQQYERFEAERSRPFFDLMALVERDPNMRVVDLGCGTGKLSACLHSELGALRTLGIDRSETMLSQASPDPETGLVFELGAIEDSEFPEPFDLIFSNAALHWVDDHPRLLDRLAGTLAENGQLAVQVPSNHDHASHIIAAELAAEEPFASALEGYVRRSPVLAPTEYSELLRRLGFARQRVHQAVYLHLLESAAAMVDWMKGTTLTAYAERLSPELYERFLETYRERILARCEDERPYVFTFKRTLFWARR